MEKKFEVVDTSPPTSLRDGEYHVIYGHSVFTHLTESSQFEWLAEISRLLSSGGRAYVTINSDRGVDISKSRPGKSAKNLAEMVLDRGIVDFGPLSVGVDAKEPGYYRMTAHSHEYVRQNWSKYLNVLGFVEFFADHQDLVVLEKT